MLAALLLTGVAANSWLRPPISDWQPIYAGIDYWCGTTDLISGSSNRMMALRIHLDEVSLEISLRPPERESLGEGGHFRLVIADRERARQGLSVLINTTIYTPQGLLTSYPGKVVSSLETVVINRRATHIHEHSYLFWLDGQRKPFFSDMKPPREDEIAAAAWGFGMQAVQLRDGRVNPGTLDPKTPPDALSFIGFNEEERLLYLIAHEHASKYEMLDAAIGLGVKTGGLMDGGSATTLILDGQAKGLRPYTGIRGTRPLGGYLGIRAKSLR